MNKSLLTRIFPRGLLVMIYLVSTFGSASAQGGRQINISAPDPGNFPRMTFYFDLFERDGGKITDLTADQLTLREDGLERDVLDFQALTPGIQIVAAINLSPPFAIQDISGKSRFEYIREGLLNWAGQPLDSSPDDISLLTNDGIELTHLSDKNSFSAALIELQPNLRETEANLNVLARAIEIASDPVSQLGMKKVVLFFSTQTPAESAAALDSLLAQARENQVQIYTILISSPAFFASPGASRLQILSTETGGAFTPFSGEEPLVDFGQLLAPLRTTYFISYDSQIVTAGDHNLELTVSTSLGDSREVKDFYLDVQPPNPILVSPPREITRKSPPAGDQNTEIILYQPQSITLDILVEFPDNHPRELEELIFRVDGEVVERKTTPPFNSFVWDLSGYQSSATHRLTIEAVDVLGLSRLSLQTPIEVKVEVPPPDLGTIFSNNALALGGLGIILLAGMVLFLMISRGRIQPQDPIGLGLRGKRNFLDPSRKRILPLKRDSQAASDQTRELAFSAYRLIPINDLSQQLFPAPIRIAEPEIKLGSDPGMNQIHIDHHSIAREHAQIGLGKGNRHQIRDLGSLVGTWINYQQIAGSKPHLLKDGDIINIGEAGFRFQIIATTAPESSSREKSK